MGDLRYAFRQLQRSPGFTAVTVLSLSLGIAANTTIFSFVNVLLLRPPPVEAPEQLWQVWRQNLRGGSVLERYQPLSYPGYALFPRSQPVFPGVGAPSIPETPFVSWNRNGIGQAVQAQFVSGDFFAACRTAMALGRAFGPQEDRQPGADPVAVVSHGFWRTSLGGDPQVVGRTLSINGGERDGRRCGAGRLHRPRRRTVSRLVASLHDGPRGTARPRSGTCARGRCRSSEWAG